MLSLNELRDQYSTYEEFVDAIDKEINLILQEDPEFVYPNNSRDGCNYDSGPNSDIEKCSGCLFGRAFKNLNCVIYELGSIEITLNKRGINCPKKWKFYQLAQDRGVFYGQIKEFYNSVLDFMK